MNTFSIIGKGGALRTITLDELNKMLSSRAILRQSGKTQLRVVRVSEPLHKGVAIAGSKIANFNAMTEKQSLEVVALVEEAMASTDQAHADACIQKALNVGISSTLLPNSPSYKTVAGSTVNAIVGEVELRDGSTDLRINSIEEMQTVVASRKQFSFGVVETPAVEAAASVGAETSLSGSALGDQKRL